MGCKNPVPPLGEVVSSAEPANLNTVRLFGPGAPIRGMNSYAEPFLVGDGEFPLLQNVRVTDGLPSVRRGTAQYYANTGLPAGTVLGSYMGPEGEVIVIGTGGFGQIYLRSGGAWVEITQAAGPNGNTRLTSDTLPVHIAVVREPMIRNMQVFTDPADRYFVFQNGSDYPRIANTKAAYLTVFDMGLAAPIAQPDPETARAQPICGAYYNLQGTVTKTESDATNMPATVTLDATGQWLQVDFETGIGDGDNVLFDFANISLEVEPYQMHVVFACADPNVWNSLEVAIQTNAGTEYMVYSPNDPDTIPIITALPHPTGSYYQVAFNLYRVVNGGVDMELPSGTYDKFKITWRGNAPPADVALKIYAIAFGGQIGYGARFGISYFCGGQESGSYREGGGPRTESPLTDCVIERTQVLKDIGGTPIPNLRLAEVSGFRYRYRIRYANPTTLSSTSPVTHLLVYAKYVGEVSYTLTYWNPPRVGKWTGAAWAYESGTSRSVRTLDVNAEASTQRLAPSRYATPIPIGTCMLYNGSRLFIGNAKVDSTTTGVGQYAVTERDRPFRSEWRVRSDNGYINPDSGTYGMIPNQTIQAFVEASGTPLGADGIILLTDSGLFSLDNSGAINLSAPRWIAPLGTLSPKSVISWNGEVTFVDAERQVRAAIHELRSLSANRVEDYLSGIPDAYVDDVASVVFQDKLFIAFTPLGATTNTHVLVYDYRSGAFTLDVKPFDIRAWHVVKSGTTRKLYGVHGDRTIHQHETTDANDSGTSITARIDSRTFIGDGVESIVLGQCHVRAAAATGTITCTRTAFEDTAVTASGTITTAVSGTKVLLWKSDRNAGNIPSLRSDTISLSLTITGAAPGYKLYDALVEIEGALGGPTS